MEEKGFRTLQCGVCPAKLRITITPAQYGKRLEVACPKCGEKGFVTIPVPAVVPEQEQSRPQSMSDVFGDVFGDLGDLFGKPPK